MCRREKKEIYFECSLHIIIIATRSESQVVMMMKYKSVHEEKKIKSHSTNAEAASE